jgi:hypothetical protein
MLGLFNCLPGEYVMIRIRVLTLVLFASLLPSAVAAGTIFETSHRTMGAVKVLVVKSPVQADLLVFVARTAVEARGKDHIWFYTNMQTLADATIVFVKNHSEADVKVYFVTNQTQAGWRASHRCRGSFK